MSAVLIIRRKGGDCVVGLFSVNSQEPAAIENTGRVFASAVMTWLCPPQAKLVCNEPWELQTACITHTLGAVVRALASPMERFVCVTCATNQQETQRLQDALREQSARALAALKFLRRQLRDSEAKAHREHERAESLAQQLEALQEAMRAQSVRSLACIQELRAQIEGKKVIGPPAGSSKALPATLQSQAVLQAYAKRLHAHVESALDLLADKERAAQKQRMEELRQRKLGLEEQIRAAGPQDSATLDSFRESLAEQKRLLGDAQRMRYFPEAEGYLVSSNVDGVFVGVKDFRLCKLDGHCIVSASSNSSTPTILLQWGATRAPSTRVSPEVSGNVNAADREHHSSGGVLSFQAEDMCIHNLKPLGISEWQTTRFKRLFVEMNVQLTVPLQWSEEADSWRLGPGFEVEILSFSKEIVGDVDAPSFVLKMLVRKALEQNLRQLAAAHLPAALVTYMRSTHDPLLELECQVRVEGLEASLLDKPLETLSSEQLHDWLGLSPLQLSTLMDAQRRFRLTPFVLGTMRQLLEYRRFHCRSATQPQWRRLLQLWQRTIDLTVASDARGGELEQTDETATAEFDFESTMTKLWQTVGRQPLVWNLGISHAAVHVLVERMLATGEDSGRGQAVVKPDGSFPKLQRLLAVVRDNVHGARLTGIGSLTGEISWEFSLFELLDDLNSLTSIAARMKSTPLQADGGRQMVRRPEAVATEPRAAQDMAVVSVEGAEMAPGSRRSDAPEPATGDTKAVDARTPPKWDAHHTAWDGELWT